MSASAGIPHELWSATDLAAYLGKPIKYVYRLTHERRIDHYVIGRELRFDPEHVRAFLRESHYGTQPGGSESASSGATTTRLATQRAGRPRRDWGSGR